MREVDGEEAGAGTPSSYVLREMEKTNIWPSAVGCRPLNDCAAGRQKPHTGYCRRVSSS